MMTERAPTERFSWLRDKLHRRLALLEVYQALRRGQLIDDRDRRADLVRELHALLVSPDLSERERARIARIFEALGSGPPADSSQ